MAASGLSAFWAGAFRSGRAHARCAPCRAALSGQRCVPGLSLSFSPVESDSTGCLHCLCWRFLRVPAEEPGAVPSTTRQYKFHRFCACEWAIIMINWAERGSAASVRIASSIRCEMASAEPIQAQDKRQMSILRKGSSGFASSCALARWASVSGTGTPSASEGDNSSSNFRDKAIGNVR
jgi:hypothetical protein